MDKKDLRSVIFRHLDGIVTLPVLVTLKNADILQLISNNEKVTLNELANQFNANEGYLNVALRVLASQGFLKYQVEHNCSFGNEWYVPQIFYGIEF